MFSNLSACNTFPGEKSQIAQVPREAETPSQEEEEGEKEEKEQEKEEEEWKGRRRRRRGKRGKRKSAGGGVEGWMLEPQLSTGTSSYLLHLECACLHASCSAIVSFLIGPCCCPPPLLPDAGHQAATLPGGHLRVMTAKGQGRCPSVPSSCTPRSPGP